MRDDNTLSDKNAESLNWNIRDDLKGLSLEEIRAEQPKLGFSICMLNTTGSLNIGVAIRSAVLFGADKVFIAGRRRYDKRSTVGAQNYIDVERIDCYDNDILMENDLIDHITKAGYEPLLIEQDGTDITTIEGNLPLIKYCLILGEEKDGIPSSLLNKNLRLISIPQWGVLRSLNVSIAASIAMYEFAKLLGD